MGFTTSCFIRKNTEELRKKLEDIGHKNAGSSNHHDIIYTDAEYGVYFTTFASNITDDEVAYDCGYNRTLFLAIAGLRDDTDIMQWFTDGEYWYKNKIRDRELERFGAECPAAYHKATLEECIKHFQ